MGRSNERPEGDGLDAWWRDAPTPRRLASLTAANDILDGVLREARAVDAAHRHRIAERAGERIRRPLALVVDDDPDWRAVCEAALRQLGGLRVVTAGDGEEGWHKAAALRPDVVIADFSMPRMDGAALVERLVAEDVTRSIPVLMVSAFAGEVPRATRLACDGFLAKPCDPAELCRLAIVAIAIGRDPARPQSPCECPP